MTAGWLEQVNACTIDMDGVVMGRYSRDSAQMCSNTPLVPVLAGIELAGRHWLLLGNGLGISQWEVRSGIEYHPGLFRFYLFLSCLMMMLIIYFVSIIKLLVSQPTSCTFFFPLFLSLSHWDKLGEWMGGCMVLKCCLGLNHNTPKRKVFNLSLKREGLSTAYNCLSHLKSSLPRETPVPVAS